MKVKAHIIVHTRVNEDDETIVAFYNYIAAIDSKSHKEENGEDALPKYEEGTKATADDLKKINLGTLENLGPIYLNVFLSLKKEETYVKLL